MNPEVFTDDEYFASYVTNRPHTVNTNGTMQDTTDKSVLNTPKSSSTSLTSVTIAPQDLQPFPKAGA